MKGNLKPWCSLCRVPSANSEDEVKRAGKVLSHIVFEAGRKKDLTATEFQELAALQENLHLTLSQISLLFRNILAKNLRI